MLAYHEVAPDQLQSILSNGLKKESRGSKGDDEWIVKADAYLDAHRPKNIVEAKVSRDDNIYAYYVTETSVIDIVDGAHIPRADFIHAKSGALLELHIDPKRSYISDLDTYDALKTAFSKHEKLDTLEMLAKSYWNKITRLDTFRPDVIRRPEIMITYSLDPRDLRKC